MTLEAVTPDQVATPREWRMPAMTDFRPRPESIAPWPLVAITRRVAISGALVAMTAFALPFLRGETDREIALLAGRYQMAFSLGWHIVLACFGVGLPVLCLVAEGIALRTGNPLAKELAMRWARGLAVLFAIGAVSGTILSFELGMLWPGLMGPFGEVIGLPFAIEGIAFFIEAIFIGIYLYGGNVLTPRQHFLSGIPIVVSGILSAFFVVTANAFMNQPEGFRMVDGRVVDGDPWAAMFNAAVPYQTVHMILAAFVVAGFCTASLFAWRWLKGERGAYQRLGFVIAFSVAAIATPLQIVSGDLAASFVARNQPAKFAAMEGLMETQEGAPLHLGGVLIDSMMVGSIEIPKGASLLAFKDPNAEVKGLLAFAEEDRPPAAVVHAAFQIMVLIGTVLLLTGVLFGWVAWRHRRLPTSVWAWRLATCAGPLSVLALEAGWVVTEVGRQPWIVQGILRTKDAFTESSGVVVGYGLVLMVYGFLTVASVFVLLRIAQVPLRKEFTA